MAIYQVQAVASDILGRVILADRFYSGVTEDQAAASLHAWVIAEGLNAYGDIEIRSRLFLDVANIPPVKDVD